MAEKAGRPTVYSLELAAEICARLTEGEPLVKICRDEHIPSTTTVYRWLATNEPFRDLYARAREDQADTLADQIIDIADENPATIVGEEDGKEVVRVDSAAIAHQRLRVDARKWIAAKLKPKKYGERVDHDHSGEIDHKHAIKLEPREVARRVAYILVHGNEPAEEVPVLERKP
jgi:hypothetical protein